MILFVSERVLHQKPCQAKQAASHLVSLTSAPHNSWLSMWPFSKKREGATEAHCEGLAARLFLWSVGLKMKRAFNLSSCGY